MLADCYKPAFVLYAFIFRLKKKQLRSGQWFIRVAWLEMMKYAGNHLLPDMTCLHFLPSIALGYLPAWTIFYLRRYVYMGWSVNSVEILAEKLKIAKNG